MAGLSTEAQSRYAYIAGLLRRDFPPPARIVELGAAPGDQIAQLARAGYEATAVDIGVASDHWGDAADGRMADLLSAAGVADVAWDLERTPYPLEGESFDAVIMTEVFEHLRDYPIRSLHEVARVLKPDGRLYFTTPNQAYLVNRLRLLIGRNVQTPLHDWIGGLPFARHAREYTVDEVRALMQHAGLRIVTLESRHFYIDGGRGGAARLIKRVIGRLAVARPSLGPLIIVVAERGT